MEYTTHQNKKDKLHKACTQYSTHYNQILERVKEVNWKTYDEYVKSYLSKDLYDIMRDFLDICSIAEHQIKKFSRVYSDEEIDEALEDVTKTVNDIVQYLRTPVGDLETISFILSVVDLYHGIFLYDDAIVRYKYKTDGNKKLKTMYDDLGTQFKKFSKLLETTSETNVVIPILMKDVEELMYSIHESVNGDIEKILETYLFKFVNFYRLLLCLRFHIDESVNVHEGFMNFAKKKMLDDFYDMEKNYDKFVKSNKNTKIYDDTLLYDIDYILDLTYYVIRM